MVNDQGNRSEIKKIQFPPPPKKTTQCYEARHFIREH